MVSDVRHDVKDTHTVVSTTHNAVSDIHQGVFDTQTIVTDIHRSLMKSQGTDGKNQSVSVASTRTY